MAGSLERRGPNWHFQPFVRPVDFRVWLVKVQIGRDHTVMRCKYALDETRNSRGALQVPQVRLDRADQTTLSERPSSAKHGAERNGFDGISNWCTRAMGFYEIHAQ